MILAAAGPDSGAGIVRDLLVILGSAALLGIALRRLRLALIPAYLLTGAAIGPQALGFVPYPESLGTISRLAIMLLLFGVGLELHLSALRADLVRLLTVGILSCLITVFAGWPVARALGLPGPAALVTSMALSLSSTSVVLRLLAERRHLRDPVGRASVAVLVTQDMLALLMLAGLPLVAVWAGAGREGADLESLLGNPRNWTDLLGETALRLAGVGAMILASRFLLPRLLSESLRSRSTEMTLLIGLAFALGAAVLAQAIGLSLEMGAFIAGFVLADTAFRSQLSGQIGPLRDVFLALFFTTLGMKLGPSILLESGVVILIAVSAMMLMKAVVIGIVSFLFGLSLGTSVAVGIYLAQAGEFSLIMLDSAERLRILDPEHNAVIVAVVVMSLLLTPALLALGRYVRRILPHGQLLPWIRKRAEPAPGTKSPETVAPSVLIGGFGPLGRRLAQDLEQAGIRYTVIELNPDTVREQQAAGRSVLLGDVGNVEVLESAGIRHADALAITVSDDLAALRGIAVARRIANGLFIAARVTTVSRVNAAREAGADLVLADETAAADVLAQAIMARQG